MGKSELSQKNTNNLEKKRKIPDVSIYMLTEEHNIKRPLIFQIVKESTIFWNNEIVWWKQKTKP